MGETYECAREFERKRRTNVCNSADVEDSPQNGDRLGSGGLGPGGLGRGSEGVGVGELGSGVGLYVLPAVGRIFHVANPLATNRDTHNFSHFSVIHVNEVSCDGKTIIYSTLTLVLT